MHEPGRAASHKILLGRSVRRGAELVIVMGPNDGSPGSHWVGAVLSVTGATAGLPTLAEAMHDELFYPGSSRYLAEFDPKRISRERAHHARQATIHALDIYRARRDGRNPPQVNSDPGVPQSRVEANFERAAAIGKNIRAKFERVYESARKAVDEGELATARVKCRAALDLLREQNLYGPAQGELERALEREIERLTAP